MADDFDVWHDCTLCKRKQHIHPWVYKFGMMCPGDPCTQDEADAFNKELAWREEVNGRFGNETASDPELTELLLKRREAALERQNDVIKREVPLDAVVSTTQVAHVDATTTEVTQKQEIAEVLAEPAEFEISVPHLEVPGEVPQEKKPLTPRHSKQGTKHKSSDYMLFMGERETT